jgi:hypothetical protein
MLYNWVQDFEMQLGNAALANSPLNRVTRFFPLQKLVGAKPSLGMGVGGMGGSLLRFR